MNLDNLTVGQRYKTYKLLCETLDENVKGGNSKIAQLKDWSRYFNFKVNQNRSIEIVEIYEDVKEKEDSRCEGNNSIYTKDIQILLLALLLEIEEMEDEEKNYRFKDGFARYALYSELSMINENYKILINNSLAASKLLKIYRPTIEIYCKTTSKKLKLILETAINSLVKKEIIECKLINMVYTEDKIYRKATSKEEIIYNKIKTSALEREGCLNFSEAYIKRRYDRVKIRIDSKLKEHNIIRFYNIYDIKLKDKNYIYGLMKSEQVQNLQDVRNRLNNNIISGIRKFNKNEYQNIKKYKKITDENNDINLDILIKLTLSINEKSIEKDILKYKKQVYPKLQEEKKEIDDVASLLDLCY